MFTRFSAWAAIFAVNLMLCPLSEAVTVSADLDGDGVVSHGDLLNVLQSAKESGFGGDLILNGKVDSDDILELVRQWRSGTIHSSYNVILSFKNSAAHESKLLTGGLAVTKGFEAMTCPPLQNAFITFDRVTVQGPGGPPRDIFQADTKSLDLDDLAVTNGFAESTAPEPARKVDLLALENLDNLLGGIDFEGSRLNWIRFQIVEDFPNTYAVDLGGETKELKVPSNKFRIISAGNKVTIDPDSLNFLTVDLDVCRSIFERATDGFILKPVTKLLVNEDEVDDASEEFE
jgi:hypothetical protein